MNHNFDTLQELAIPFPIPASFRRQASIYASQYFTSDAEARIYYQTLAVLVVDGYLRLLGFETNLAQPTRWNALHRLWSEGNELELPGLGKLECCVITAEQQSIILPAETALLPENWSDGLQPIVSDRIGYIFVEIPSSEHTATLLGFLPAAATTDAEITISDLQSMDDFIDYLTQRETFQTNDLTREFAEKKITYLRNWLNNIYEADWELSTRDLRGATCKKKLKIAGQVFTLQLSVSQSNSELMLVRVVVQGENTPLPLGMQVSVPDEAEIYTETVNETADMIAIPLELATGEEFWVELQLGEDTIREYFSA